MAMTSVKKVWSALVVSALLAGSAHATELLNSSYDVSRELFAALNPAFQKQWAEENNGDKLVIKQSHAGSSKQALAILQGLKADVVTYNQVSDVQILHDKGNLIPADWQARLPNNSSPFYSTMAFLVRKGNPKNIHDWSDLVRPDVKLIFPNPKTSGNARYTYLGAWDGVDAGGSYVFVQRWEHNLKQLNRMSTQDQEMIIGRTKEANEEIDGDERPETSHLTRVDLKENGKGLKIVRQSLPYGTASGTHGLYFIAYCARLHNIEQQLLSMFGETDGKRDGMLRFTKPVTGGYYFAPSLDKLLNL